LDSPTLNDYEDNLSKKVNCFESKIRKFYTDNLQIYPSPPEAFRLRAEFRVFHDETGAHYAMTDSITKKPYIIKEFRIAGPKIQNLMPVLLSAINGDLVLRKQLFGVEFLTTLSGEALITLLYHKNLDQNWEQSASEVQDAIGAMIIGRSKKQKITLKNDFVTEEVTLGARTLLYRQVESGFTQPNGQVNIKMLSWALQQTEGSQADLLEIYCGNGNFTLALADNFEKILAVEISKLSIKTARHNSRANGIKNTSFIRMSSEELTQAIDGIRPFRRLRNISLNEFNFSTVLVDPPRSGLDPTTISLILRYKKIIYFSCNPLTLMQNLIGILPTHKIAAVAVFDQFAWTDHLEIGLVLEAQQN
jgi:tRNA (uracil-5-)-methyltransferase